MNAYSCHDVNYGRTGTYFTASGLGTDGTAEYGVGTRGTYTISCQANNTSNAPGSVVTAADTLRAATAQTAGLISNRIAFVRNQASIRVPYSVALDESGNAHLGFAAGDMEKGIGVWVQGSFSHMENDSVATQYSGNVYTGLFGIDKTIGKKGLVGLSLGYEKTKLETQFNNGNFETKNYIIAPYASLTLKHGFSVDASVGYTDGEFDQDRLETQTSEQFTANNTDLNRVFGSLNLNANKKVKMVNFGGTLGVLYSREHRDSFVETGATTAATVAVASQNTTVGQARFGVNGGFQLGKYINPYGKVSGVYDFTKTKLTVGANQAAPATDDLAIEYTVGINLAAKGVMGTFEAYTVENRKDWEEYGATARLRINF